MQNIALSVLIGAALWLVAVGVFMAAKPAAALRFLGLTASSHRVNLTEQGLRMVAGCALVVRSPYAETPEMFAVAGWFIIVSSAALMVVPLHWHAGYAIWWAERMPHWAVRLIAPLSIVFGITLVCTAL